VWWTHTLLHSESTLPKDRTALFGTMPYHFFKVARFQTLNQAGYHAAHILSAKKGDTDRQAWTRAELERRMLVNIHPCNVFLGAKPEWTRNGGRPDIINWVTNAYLRRYGAIMERFLADTAPAAFPAPVNDPLYNYAMDGADMASYSRRNSSARSQQQKLPNSDRVGRRLVNRPIIWRDLVGSGIWLEISAQGGRYVLPHDDLVFWARENTSALQTASWSVRGLYSWPSTTRGMLTFLRGYVVTD
jgi:hypothetical protein